MTPRLSRSGLIGVLAALAFVLRLGYGLWTVDPAKGYYWEYGELAKNLHAGKGYSLFHEQDGRVVFLAADEARPVPSAYMPPAYVIVLWPFIALDDVAAGTVGLLTLQALLGALAVVLAARLTGRYFLDGAAVPAAVLTAFLPEFIYASASFTPTVLFHVLVLLLFLLLYRYGPDRAPSAAGILGLGATALALLYLRSETVLLAGFVAVMIGRWHGWRRGVVFLLVVGAGYAPWTVRNSMVFGRIVPMTTSGGLNLFRGQNPEGRTAWSDDVLDARLASVPVDSAYEPAVDALYRERVGELVAADPAGLLVRGFTKVFHLWIFDPTEERSLHPLYLLPWVLMLGLGAYGAMGGRVGRGHAPVVLFLAYATILAFAVLVLPRYQTMMKIAVIPFAAMGVRTLLSRFIDFPR